MKPKPSAFEKEKEREKFLIPSTSVGLNLFVFFFSNTHTYTYTQETISLLYLLCATSSASRGVLDWMVVNAIDPLNISKDGEKRREENLRPWVGGVESEERGTGAGLMNDGHGSD